MKSLSRTFAFVVIMIISHDIYAQTLPNTPTTTPQMPQATAAASIGVQQTQVVDTKKEALVTEQAKLFGLTKEEWSRYEELMKGPQRFQNPNTDPVFVLGTFAKNEAERAKYAELAVKNMHKYMSGVLAFQRAYQAAQTKLFGHMPMLYDDKNKRTEPLKPFSGALNAGDRIIFFTRIHQCDDCKAQLQKTLAFLKQQEGKSIGLDIYFMDSGREDKVAQKYAADNGVPLKWIQSKTITLNHENGELYRLDDTRAAPTTTLHRGTEYYDFQMP